MEVSEASYQFIADLLSRKTGQHLTESRRWRVATALAGVFRSQGIDNVDQLVCLLADKPNPDLTQEVVEALLNNETYFFRDKPTFDQLPDNILPELAQARKATRRLSIWCAGCSTGQEVHSIAMMIADQGERWHGWTIELLGSDVSQKAITTARSGLYTQFEVQRGLSVAQMLKHFDEIASGWQLHRDIRERSRFQQHNVLDAPPGRGEFDLILCRNVLLYFDPKVRKMVFDRLRSALSPDGYLMLGAGETVVGQTDAFVPVSNRPSLYQPSSALKPASMPAIV